MDVGRDSAARVEDELSTAERWELGPLSLVLVFLLVVSRLDYAVFHMLVEGFCTIVAAAVFIVVYNTRRLLTSHYVLFVGVGLMSFIVIGIPHILGFQGVQLFRGFDSDLPTQAFIAQRLLLAITFLAAPLFLRRKFDPRVVFAGFLGVSVLALLSMLVWRNFPHMFIEGVGLTPLKKTLEYVIAAMFALSAAVIVRLREQFPRYLLWPTVVGLGCLTASEISFTLYSTPFGWPNLIGHLLQVAAFWFIYRAAVVTSLVAPFSSLFRDLAQSEQSALDANVRLNAVATISDAAISSLDTEHLVKTLLDRLVDVMGSDGALLLIAEGEQLRVFSAVGVDEEGFSTAVGVGFAGGIAKRRTSDYVYDAQTDPRVVSMGLKRQGIRSMLGVPLIVGDRLLGVLHVDWKSIHDYSPNELQLLEIVADRFSLALQNALLYQQEHHVADVLQESLLALPENVAGFRFSTVYRSAFQAARVGGDFYDLFRIDTDCVGVVIGDVSGKGLDAAVLTSLVRNTIRAHAIEPHRSPAEVIELTSTMLERNTDDATFVTLFFGVLDVPRQRLTYCNAGHTTVVVIRHDGGLGLLTATSPVAGAFANTTFEDGRIEFGPSDRLVLYTDGVIEARNKAGHLYGESRLFDVLSRLNGSEVDRITEAVIDDVSAFAEGSLSDDVAILAVECSECHVPDFQV